MDISLDVSLITRNDTEQNWTSKNPILSAGERGFVTSGTHAGMSKTGDGTNKWTNLNWDKAVSNGGNADTVGGYTVSSDVPSNLSVTLNNKVDKVSGKGLSTNDFTSTYKNKLDGIESGAQVNVQADWNQSSTSNDGYIKNKPTKLSSFSNDVGFITQESDPTVPSWAKSANKPTYNAGEISLSSISGMSAKNCQQGISELKTNITELESQIANVPSFSRYTATLSSSGWSSSSPYTQTISIPGIQSSDYPVVDIIISGSSDADSIKSAWGNVDRIVSNSGSITAYCYSEKPTSNIPIQLLITRD